MSLKNPVVPGEILRAFTAGLGDFIASGGPLWSLLLSKSFALQAQNVRLPILAKTRVPDDPSPDWCTIPASLLASTGWRFLVAEGDLYGACHVGSIEQGAPPLLTGFSDDPLVLTAVERFNEIPKMLTDNSIQGDFTPSVLRVTWARLEAFWLRADAGCDWIIPYAGFVDDEPADPNFTGFKMMTPYSAWEFLHGIRPLAQSLYNNFLRSTSHAKKAQAQRILQQASTQERALKAYAEKLENEARAAGDQAASLPNHGKEPSD
jgi:hypothetical protein